MSKTDSPSNKALSSEPKSPSVAGSQSASPFSEALSMLIFHIDSLASTLPLAMKAIANAIQQAARDIENYTTISTDADKGVTTLKMNFEGLSYYESLVLRKPVAHAALATRIIPRSFLVSLISQYDVFLGALIRAIYLAKPELLNASERQLSLVELVSFGSINAARDYVIEKEVESMLRKSHSEQFEALEKMCSIKLRQDLDIWPQFIELTERRNLFVHTGGVVSKQYLDVCNKHGVPELAAVSKGQQLEVSTDYFIKSYQCMYEMACKLTQVLWRKLMPGDCESADKHLLHICYMMLLEEQYCVACKVLDFATETLKKHSSDRVRRTLVINRAQAHKWLGDRASVDKIIRSHDWSAASDEFKLAEAVLLDDFEAAVRVMRAVNVGDLRVKQGYRDWPLYKEFRKSQVFVEAFEEIYGEPFHAAEHPEASRALEDGGIYNI